MFGTCVDCGVKGTSDCALYVCRDAQGFTIVCCIVYAIVHGLSILKRIDSPTDYED
mgnify:CR=1 FL=1